MIKKINPYWIITLAICIGILAFPLFQHGMFMDGIQYACVSKNFANGLGTFWQPYLSPAWEKAGSNIFLEHPPLVYLFQGVFFKLFGNVFYVERLYSVCSAFIVIYLIHLFWKELFKNNSPIAAQSWLPVLLWIIIPLDFWGFHNNIQENTMGIFVLLSALCSIKAINDSRKSYLFILLSGISIFGASLCKGLPGLFPLSIFFFYWVFNKEFGFKKMLIYSLLIFFIPVVLYIIVLQSNDAYNSLHFYLTKRLFYRINNEPTVDNKFSILFQTIMESLHVIILTILIIIWMKFKKTHTYFIEIKKAFFLFALGLSGIAPMMLTPTQRIFYVTPAMPFLVMGMATLITPFLIDKLGKTKKHFYTLRILGFGLMLLSIAIVGMQYNNFNREKDKLSDVFEIGKIVPKFSEINVSQDLYFEWSFQFYLNRYYDIYLNHKTNKNYNYYLKQKSDTVGTYNKTKIDLNTCLYDLYKETK